MKPRYFQIEWNSKKNPDVNRKTRIMVSKASPDIGAAAKSALNIFIASCGNLTKNNVILIQEIDKEGNPIGEPITEQSEGIMPVAHK